MNDLLRAYRSLLQDNEDDLKAHNLYGLRRVDTSYPYPKTSYVDNSGIYSTPFSYTANQYLQGLDLLRISNSLRQLPTIRELSEFLKTESAKETEEAAKRRVEISRKIINVILGGLEPHKIIGPVMALVLEQPNIRDWIDDVRLGDSDGALILELDELIAGSKITDNKEPIERVAKASKVLEVVKKSVPHYYDY